VNKTAVHSDLCICLPCSMSVTVSPLISRCNRIWGTYNAFASLVLVSPHGMPSWQVVTLHMPSSAWVCTNSCAQCTIVHTTCDCRCLLLLISSDHRWCVEKCGLTETLFCQCTTEWSLHVNSCECMHVVALHSACISCPCGRSDLYLLGWSFSCRCGKQLG